MEVAFGDSLDIDSIRAALKDVRAAYYVYPLSRQNLSGTANFAQAAKEAGVSAIVNMSQITARPDSVSHISKDHWLAEQVLNWSGIPVTHLRPTLCCEWMLYPFSWQDYAKRDTLAPPFGSGKLALIAAEDQGRVIAAILTNPAEHAGEFSSSLKRLHSYSSECLAQHFGSVSMDVESGITGGIDNNVEKLTGQRPLSVQEFVQKNREAFASSN